MPNLDTTFTALADPTRRAILAKLSMGPSSVSQLAEPYEMSLPAVMKHLRVLEKAGLVSQKKTGRVRECTLSAKPLKGALDWVSQYKIFWEERFDALERYLAEEKSKEEVSCHTPKRSRRSRS